MRRLLCGAAGVCCRAHAHYRRAHTDGYILMLHACARLVSRTLGTHTALSVLIVLGSLNGQTATQAAGGLPMLWCTHFYHSGIFHLMAGLRLCDWRTIHANAHARSRRACVRYIISIIGAWYSAEWQVVKFLFAVYRSSGAAVVLTVVAAAAVIAAAVSAQ